MYSIVIIKNILEWCDEDFARVGMDQDYRRVLAPSDLSPYGASDPDGETLSGGCRNRDGEG
jgi:hypothetical protein